MLELLNISVSFGGVVALDSVSASFSSPVVGLVGPNGAGKTTLMNVLSGFLRSRSGSVVLDGVRLEGRPAPERARLGLRRTFQQDQVVDDLSLRDNVLAVADHLSINTVAEIERALHLTGMSAHAGVVGARLNQFQRRMTEIAKALIGKPKLILMDEPAAGLDESESSILRELVAMLPVETGAQIVLIDHDTQLISDLCQETIVLDFGKVIAKGPTRFVLADSRVRQAYFGMHG
jgi:branched-chain amino acid transport system ATP-binding protein